MTIPTAGKNWTTGSWPRKKRLGSLPPVTSARQSRQRRTRKKVGPEKRPGSELPAIMRHSNPPGAARFPAPPTQLDRIYQARISGRSSPRDESRPACGRPYRRAIIYQRTSHHCECVSSRKAPETNSRGRTRFFPSFRPLRRIWARWNHRPTAVPRPRK